MHPDDAAAFATLGLCVDDANAAADEDDIRAAFRKRALGLHPDKQQLQQGDGGGGGGFAELVDARERALRWSRGRRGCMTTTTTKTAGNQTLADSSAPQPQPPPPLAPVDWAIWLLGSVLTATTPRPIVVDLAVSLEDVFNARVKKVVIGVHRAGVGQPFERSRQTLLVRLVNPSREDAIGRVVVPGAGDDPPAAVILGKRALEDDRTFPRGDVHVHVRILSHPVFSPDPVLCPSDLHVRAAVSLAGHYFGETVRVPHPSGSEPPIEVRYEEAAEEGDAGDDDGGSGATARQVRVVRGMGLPYLDRPDDKAAVRGDLYVFMSVRLPPIPPSSSGREALRTWLAATFPPPKQAWNDGER